MNNKLRIIFVMVPYGLSEEVSLRLTSLLKAPLPLRIIKYTTPETYVIKLFCVFTLFMKKLGCSWPTLEKVLPENIIHGGRSVLRSQTL